jgi:hypothetical protein
MKYAISFLALLTCFAFKTPSTLQDCGETPELNKQIIEIVKSKMNTKVGRGECWDLAAEALKGVNAKWNGMYVFGKEVNYKKECIFAGDIIQFERVKLKYTKNGISYVEEMTHHTAVIYEVKAKGIYMLAHQNTTETGKKVGLSEMDVNDVTKGKFKIYRPEK